MSHTELVQEVEYRAIALLPDFRFGCNAVVQKLSKGGQGTKTPAGQWAEVQSSRRPTGYSWVQIGSRDAVGPVRLDEVICRAWHGDRPSGTECVHRDRDRSNCKPDNLYWGVEPEHAIDHSVEFREIADFDGYRFYRNGVIGSQWATGFTTKTDVWRRIDGTVLASGHIQVAVKRNGKTRRYGAHHLVCWAWHGSCPDGMECCHKNGIPVENREDNLRWGTAAENMEDRRTHGVMVCGERQWQAKLNDDLVREIRKTHENGRGVVTETAKALGVSDMAIHKAIRRESWKHVI